MLLNMLLNIDLLISYTDSHHDLSEGILAKNTQKLSRRKQGAYFILSSPMMTTNHSHFVRTMLAHKSDV